MSRKRLKLTCVHQSAIEACPTSACSVLFREWYTTVIVREHFIFCSALIFSIVVMVAKDAVFHGVRKLNIARDMQQEFVRSRVDTSRVIVRV